MPVILVVEKFDIFNIKIKNLFQFYYTFTEISPIFLITYKKTEITLKIYVFLLFF